MPDHPAPVPAKISHDEAAALADSIGGGYTREQILAYIAQQRARDALQWAIPRHTPPPPVTAASGEQMAWVIEHQDSPAGQPMYWTGFRHRAMRWSEPGDHGKACRFSRECDARRVADFAGFYIPNPTHHIRQHVWTDAGPAPSPPVATKADRLSNLAPDWPMPSVWCHDDHVVRPGDGGGKTFLFDAEEDDGPLAEFDHHEHASRAVECLNALSGLNPSGIKGAVEAARAIAKHCGFSNFYEPVPHELLRALSTALASLGAEGWA